MEKIETYSEYKLEIIGGWRDNEARYYKTRKQVILAAKKLAKRAYCVEIYRLTWERQHECQHARKCVRKIGTISQQKTVLNEGF